MENTATKLLEALGRCPRLKIVLSRVPLPFGSNEHCPKEEFLTNDCH